MHTRHTEQGQAGRKCERQRAPPLPFRVMPTAAVALCRPTCRSSCPDSCAGCKVLPHACTADLPRVRARAFEVARRLSKWCPVTVDPSKSNNHLRGREPMNSTNPLLLKNHTGDTVSARLFRVRGRSAKGQTGGRRTFVATPRPHYRSARCQDQGRRNPRLRGTGREAR